MKYLVEFNRFDMGRFSENEEPEVNEIEDGVEDSLIEEEELDELEEEEQEEEEEENRLKVWGDEIVEKKK
jgi:hypothetical protein